jgi:hypothetical protein
MTVPDDLRTDRVDANYKSLIVGGGRFRHRS